METIITNFLGLFQSLTFGAEALIVNGALLYFISLGYATLIGAKRPDGLKQKDLQGSFKEGSVFWMLLTPIIALMVLLYNVGQTIVWFVGDLGGRIANFLVTLVLWVWKEVVLAGGYLLWRLFWHYVVLWPWRLLTMAFGLMKASFNWAHYRTASLGILGAAVLVYLGNTLTYQLGWWEGLSTLFVVLSLFPLGGALARISNDLRKKSKHDAAGAQKRYWTVLGYTAGYFVALLAIQALIISAGMQTSFSFALSSLLMGGSLLASAFLILNGALLIFVLSALPNFALDYDGDHKGLLKAFGSYLWQTWARYGLGFYAWLVPAAIVSLVPTLLTEGISSVSGQFANYLYSDRVEDMEKSLKEGSDANYADWMNREAIGDDSLALLMSKDAARAAKKDALALTQANSSHLQEAYNTHASNFGATPLGACLGLFDWYGSSMRDMDKAPDYDSSSAATGQVDTADAAAAIAGSQQAISNWEIEIARRNEYKELICVGPAEQEDAANEDESEEIAAVDQVEETDCDRATASVQEAEKEMANSQAQLARNEAIKSHIDALNAASAKASASALSSGKWANFFSGLWIIVLVALSLGMAVSLYAHFNTAIYGMKDDKSGWYVTEEIQAAHKANPNQPLLGLLLFIPLFNLFVWAADYLPSSLKDQVQEKFMEIKKITTPQNSWFYGPWQMLDRAESEMRNALGMPAPECCGESEDACCEEEAVECDGTMVEDMEEDGACCGEEVEEAVEEDSVEVEVEEVIIEEAAVDEAPADEAGYE